MRYRKTLSRGSNPIEKGYRRKRRPPTSRNWIEYLRNRPDLLEPLCQSETGGLHSVDREQNVVDHHVELATPASRNACHEIVFCSEDFQKNENGDLRNRGTSREEVSPSTRTAAAVLETNHPRDDSDDTDKWIEKEPDFELHRTDDPGNVEVCPDRNAIHTVDSREVGIPMLSSATMSMADNTILREGHAIRKTFHLRSCEGIEEPISREKRDVEYLRANLDRIRKFMTPWTNILGLVIVCGSVRYKVSQYNALRTLLKWGTNTCDLPSYSSIQRTIFPHVLRSCFPKSSVNRFIVDISKAKTAFQTFQQFPEELQQQSLERRAPVRFTLPSEWAKLDVLMCPIYDRMFGQGHEKDSIELSEIVRDRAAVVSAGEFIFVSYKQRPVKAFTGAAVQFDIAFADPRDALYDGFNSENFIGGYHVQGHRSGGCTMRGIIAAVWCVGSAIRNTTSCKEALQKTNGTVKCLIQKLSKALPPSKNGGHKLAVAKNRRKGNRINRKQKRQNNFASPIEQDLILPGDIACIIYPSQSETFGAFAVVIVHRYWRHTGVRSVKLLVVKTMGLDETLEDYDRRDASDTLQREDVIGLHDVVGQVRLDCNRDGDLENASGRSVRKVPKSNRIGTLDDGTPYVVYRMLLYSDDFQPLSLKCPQGSAGGFYMLPLGLSPRDRTSRASTRLIGLTPPGVSMNQLMLHIIPDLLKASTEGVEGYTPDGESVRIFIDVVGFLGDYLESTHTVDLLGHRANAPCTACSLRKYKGGECSSLGYSSLLHASNSSVLRTGERHLALRESGIDDEDCNLLGMFGNERVDSKTCPLLVLQCELEKVRSYIRKADHGGPVVTGLFDPYRSNLVAPDHLLSGLAIDVMGLAFDILPSTEWKQRMDQMICSALAENGLVRQKSVYNVSKGNLHSMSLSATFCTLLCCVPVYRCIMKAILTMGPSQKRVLQAIETLHKLISLTYWWPQRGVDPPEDFNYFKQGDISSLYTADLQELAKSYVVQVNVLCGEVEAARKRMDKPNLHRMLELYFHTLPAFGHARHFMELVLENAHQPLKRCITNSNHHNAQVFAVTHCLGNDWQGRVSLLYQGLQRSREDGERYKKGLRRLLIGSFLDDVRMGDAEIRNVLEEADQIVNSILVEPLVGMLRSENNVCKLKSDTVVWYTVGNLQKKDIGVVPTGPNASVDVHMLHTHAIIILRMYYSEYGVGENWKFFIRSRAKRVRKLDFGHQGQNSTSHECISTGCVVQTLISRECIEREDRLLFPAERGILVHAFFAVLGVIEREEEEFPWVVAVRCSKSEKMLRTMPNIGPNDIQLLYLTEKVRRISVFHACHESDIWGCAVDACSKLLKHKGNIFSGEWFHWFDRKSGYPPRIG